MAHRTEAHRRREAFQRRATVSQQKLVTESVLLPSQALVDAHRNATDGGRRRIDGLYHAGDRVEEIPAQFHNAQAIGQEAQKELNISKVARAYKVKKEDKGKRSRRMQKSEEQVEDDESGKKSKAILDQSTEHEKLLYNELFDFFDVDGDRTWGTIEFAQRMTDIGCNTSVESAANLLYFAGVRNVDRITYDDFIQMMPKLKSFRILLEKDAMRVFAAHDRDGSGFLNRHALRDVVRTLAGPEGIDDEQVHRIVKKSDRERTGRIPFPFFIRALFGTPPVLVYTPKPRKRSILASLFGCGSVGQEDEEEDEYDDPDGPRF